MQHLQYMSLEGEGWCRSRAPGTQVVHCVVIVVLGNKHGGTHEGKACPTSSTLAAGSTCQCMWVMHVVGDWVQRPSCSLCQLTLPWSLLHLLQAVQRYWSPVQ
jgi:hypothetical protein